MTSFISVQFRAMFATTRVAVDWPCPDVLTVRLEFANDSSGTRWIRKWAPRPVAAQEVQALLASAWLSLPTRPGEFSLLLSQERRIFRAYWGTETEDAQLLAIRTGILAAAHATYLEALVHLIRGHDLVTKGQAKESAIELRKGINLLGYSYSARHVLDDTGFRKGLGESAWMDGNWEGAAHFFERVLENRTMLYATRDGLPLEPVESPLP